MPFSFVHLLTLTGLPCMHEVAPWWRVPVNWMAVPDLGILAGKSRLYSSPVCESMTTRQEFSTAFSTQPEPFTVFGAEASDLEPPANALAVRSTMTTITFFKGELSSKGGSGGVVGIIAVVKALARKKIDCLLRRFPPRSALASGCVPQSKPWRPAGVCAIRAARRRLHADSQSCNMTR